MEVGRAILGIFMPFEPLTWFLLERSYHHQDKVVPKMTPSHKGMNNLASNSRRQGRSVRMVVFARSPSAASYRCHDPTTFVNPCPKAVS